LLAVNKVAGSLIYGVALAGTLSGLPAEVLRIAQIADERTVVGIPFVTL